MTEKFEGGHKDPKKEIEIEDGLSSEGVLETKKEEGGYCIPDIGSLREHRIEEEYFPRFAKTLEGVFKETDISIRYIESEKSKSAKTKYEFVIGLYDFMVNDLKSIAQSIPNSGRDSLNPNAFESFFGRIRSGLEQFKEIQKGVEVLYGSTGKLFYQLNSDSIEFKKFLPPEVLDVFYNKTSADYGISILGPATDKARVIYKLVIQELRRSFSRENIYELKRSSDGGWMYQPEEGEDESDSDRYNNLLKKIEELPDYPTKLWEKK